MQLKRFIPGNSLLWIGLAITLVGALTYFLQQTPVIAKFDSRQPGLLIIMLGVLLSVAGFVLQPRKNPPLKSTGLMAIIPFACLVLAVLYVNSTYFAFDREKVTFKNGDVTLSGTLLIPNGDGPHPALIMMHGSGYATRMGMFAEAQSLARDGVAALIYDKRGSGASVGGHYRYDGYDALASDGAAAFNLLQSRSDIDADRIGLWGTSEAGWTAPMAASRIDQPAFLIIVSGGPITPREQGAYSIENRLRVQGFPDEDIAQAVELNNNYNAYISSGVNREGVLATIEEAEGTDWYEPAFFDSLSVPPYDQLSEHQLWWKDHQETDVEPLLEEMDFPVLFVLGANDPLIPAAVVGSKVEEVLKKAGNEDFTVEVFPDATHNLMQAPTDCKLCLPDPVIGPFRPIFAPGYLELVSGWVTERVG